MSNKNDVDQKKTPPDVSKLLPYQKRIVFRLVRAMLNGLDEKQVKTVSRAVARVTKHSDGQKNKSPYIRYYSKIYQSVAAQQPEGTALTVITKIIGKQWQSLSDEQKQAYKNKPP